MIRIASQPKPAVPAWHQGFLAMLPAIRTHVRIAFRHLNPESREEAIQNCIANAMTAYARLHELGKVDLAYPSVLARFAVAQTKDFRTVGGHLAIRDVLSAYCQKRKRITVERLDKFDTEEGQWQEIVLQDQRATPADIVRVKLDFAAWLRSLPARLRKIAKFLANGETTSAAAKKFDVSAGRISQIRKELKAAWRQFVGEDPGPGAAAPAVA